MQHALLHHSIIALLHAAFFTSNTYTSSLRYDTKLLFIATTLSMHQVYYLERILNKYVCTMNILLSEQCTVSTLADYPAMSFFFVC